MNKEHSLEQEKQIIDSAFVSILEQAKYKFIRQQDYEMAARLRDLITYEKMEEGEEKTAYMKKLIEFYRLK